MSNFQNTLRSPTFHTAPFLTALRFFRQNLKTLIKPEALGTPRGTQAQCSLPSFPSKTRLCSLCFSLHASGFRGKEATDTSGWAERDTRGSPGTRCREVCLKAWRSGGPDRKCVEFNQPFHSQLHFVSTLCHTCIPGNPRSPGFFKTNLFPVPRAPSTLTGDLDFLILRLQSALLHLFLFPRQLLKSLMHGQLLSCWLHQQKYFLTFGNILKGRRDTYTLESVVTNFS